MKKILFVCTGNTCRSPMAQGLFLKLLNTIGRGTESERFKVQSAGLFATDGMPPSPDAVEVMLSEGIDIADHRSKQLRDNIVHEADLIVTMSAAQRDYLRDRFPEKMNCIFTINELAGESSGEVIDPYGLGREAYEASLRQIKDLLGRVIEGLLHMEEKKGKTEIAIGSDHAGFYLKKELIKTLEEENDVIDCGTYDIESADYPDIAEKVAGEVLNRGILGVLICGTGIGVTIAANKIPGIRAALCWDIFTARLAREHNNANILAVGSRVIGTDLAKEILNTFIKSTFQAGRHQRRIEKIEEIERKYRERC